MIPIEVKKQRQLTLHETFEFCLSSIRHRFGRSLLTLAVVILAVAFFMYLQCNTLFRNSVKSGVEREIVTSRYPSKLLAMLYTPYTQLEFTQLLVETRQKSRELARMGAVLKFSEDRMNLFAGQAFDEMYYLRFFSGLPIGKRKELFDRREGAAMLAFLAEPGQLEATEQKMLEIGGIRVPGGAEKLRNYLAGYAAYRQELGTAFQRWNDFQAMVRSEVPDSNDSVSLRNYFLTLKNDDAKLAAWTKRLTDAGFELTPSELALLLNYEELSHQIERVQSVLYDKDYRKRWRQVYGQVKYRRMEEKLAILDDPKVLQVLRDPKGLVLEDLTEEQLRLRSIAQSLTEEQRRDIAQEFRKRRELRNLEVYLDINLFESHTGFTSAQLYLMILSFLVCVVGIANAMLMSITERFREIATLKCLGATDSFILVQIELEAMIQGLIGSLIGIALGFVVALTGAFLQVGMRVFYTFHFGSVGLAVLISLGVGLILAMLASLYPAMRASRMAPMEAMRVE